MRQEWIDSLATMVTPVLRHFAAGDLQAAMPVEAAEETRADRMKVSHLEAVARSLAVLAPWFQLQECPDTERGMRDELRGLAVSGLERAFTEVDDYLGNDLAQDLVEAAFLSQALLRAPVLYESLSDVAKAGLVSGLIRRRPILPYQNNWLLFAAMVGTFLAKVGADWDPMRVDYAIRQHLAWYSGDGSYGDGPNYHHDYYNSFVIQPMLVDIIDQLGAQQPVWQDMQPTIHSRAQRYAAVQERQIAIDGSYPVLGRSLAYRCGAFHALAQAALLHRLPEELPAGQVRCALNAVIGRTLSPAGTYDEAGWLRIGLSGHQPSIGERYISTGSCYLASFAFLPLGLPASDPFWTDADRSWTAVHVWGGGDIPCDHAL